MRSAFLMFACLYTALVGLLYAYLGRRLFLFGWPEGRIGWWLLAVPLALSYLMPFLLYWRTFRGGATPDAAFWVVYLSMVLVNSLLIAVAARDLVWLLAKGGSLAFPSWMGAWPGALETGLVSRGLILLAVLLSAWGVFESHRTPRVHTVEVPVEGLSPAFDGYRVALVSDLHVGPTIKREFVERVVGRIRSLQPDLVALTGDVADGTARTLEKESAPLADVSAKDGAFYVTGNHEYYWGAGPWVERLRSLGWTPLLNEHRVIHRGDASLVVAGLPDVTALTMDRDHAPNPRQALAGAPQGSPVLWLSHQPLTVRDVPTDRGGLMLSGHTHGGQSFPWNLVLGFFQPYEKGLYRVDRLALYVTPGTGYWGPPDRLGVPSEVTLLVLHPARAK